MTVVILAIGGLFMLLVPERRLRLTGTDEDRALKRKIVRAFGALLIILAFVYFISVNG